MLPGSYYVPKRNPSKPAGEDAHFFDKAAQVIGVADGIGGWSRKGIDSGEYSRALMKNAAKCESVLESKFLGFPVEPQEVLDEAFLKTVEKGTSTCCIVSLDDNILRAVNLGDSGFVVIRSGKVVYKSPVQQHGFNCPYQMGYGEFFRDGPWDAEEIQVALEDGDVVVVGTDGLFDNMFTYDIEPVVVRWLAEKKSPGVLARMLAEMAVENSLDDEKESPFEIAAEHAGQDHIGGKYDDVTVVAAYVSSC